MGRRPSSSRTGRASARPPTDTLWTLTKEGHAISATITLVPGYGHELRPTRDGEFWRSKMFRGNGELAALFDAAGAVRVELKARGRA